MFALFVVDTFWGLPNLVLCVTSLPRSANKYFELYHVRSMTIDASPKNRDRIATPNPKLPLLQIPICLHSKEHNYTCCCIKSHPTSLARSCIVFITKSHASVHQYSSHSPPISSHAHPSCIAYKHQRMEHMPDLCFRNSLRCIGEMLVVGLGSLWLIWRLILVSSWNCWCCSPVILPMKMMYVAVR